MDKKDMVNVIHIHLKWGKEPSDPSQQWKQSNEGFNRGDKFTYDALNRLTEAVYGENDFSDNLNDYNEKVVEYSLNGMMKRFQRRGKKSDGEYGKVDNLHIHLDGNRPVEISDDAALQTVYGAMEFRDGSTSGTEYYYDGNGSLVADANKGIAMIEYDNLNYPRRIQFTNGNTIEYVYSPDGQKLRAKWQTAAGNVVVPLNTTLSITASSTTQTDYVGDLIYTGTGTTSAVPTLSKILYPDGYFMRTSGTSGVFRYFVKDHLGNNRVVNNGSTVYQRTHYYPFGGTYADVGTASDYQPYKYNGKELDRMHGLDLYDYGARQYDPIVPMFTQQDPLAEKYYHLSPYVYCHNNPTNRIDIDGNWDVEVHLANNRSQNGYGVAVVKDKAGNEVFRFNVRAEGIKGHDRMLRGSDTPLGVYEIPDTYPWISGGSRASYGPNPRLNMIPESGEIIESKRDGIRIHGGRQESRDVKGNWIKDKDPRLKKTEGCLRAFDDDLVTFKATTDALQNDNQDEKPGKVYITDDLDKFTDDEK